MQRVTTQADVDAAVAAILEYNGTITVLVREELVATVLKAMDIVVANEVWRDFPVAERGLKGPQGQYVPLPDVLDDGDTLYIVHEEG